MTRHPFVFGRRVMQTQSFHLLGLVLVPRPRHPRSHTLSRRVAWDDPDASVALGAVAAVLLVPLVASLAESAPAIALPRLWLPTALPRKSGSTPPGSVARQPGATVLAAFAFPHRASAEASRSRSVDTAAYSARGGTVLQSDASAYPSI